MTTEIVRLARGGTVVEVDLDAGARAATWSVDGLALLRRTGQSSIEHGMYPMAPWAGRVRDNRVEGRHLDANVGPWAMHGIVLDARMSVVRADDDDQAARLVVQSRHEPGPRWPWAMRAEVTWEVRADSVRSRIDVLAVDEPFPAVLGWHPWFSRRLGLGDEAEWELSADAMARRGPDHLPTGELTSVDLLAGPFDDAFRVPGGVATVRWPGALSLGASSAPWFVVYDETDDWICLEPQSGPPDGVNDGLGAPIAWATPDEPVILDVVWAITREA